MFKTLPSVTGPKGLAGEAPPQDLAERVHAIWVEFATSGRLPWGEYSASDRQVYRLEAGGAEVEPPSLAAAFLP